MYQQMRANVDLLKIIQLGLTLTNAEGEFPPVGCRTWQFNFSFDLEYDCELCIWLFYYYFIAY